MPGWAAQWLGSLTALRILHGSLESGRTRDPELPGLNLGFIAFKLQVFE